MWTDKDECLTLPDGWNGEVSSFDIALLAEKGGSFEFLNREEEDIY